MSTLSASFEYLCNGSTAIINFQIFQRLTSEDGPRADRVKPLSATIIWSFLIHFISRLNRSYWERNLTVYFSLLCLFIMLFVYGHDIDLWSYCYPLCILTSESGIWPQGHIFVDNDTYGVLERKYAAYRMCMKASFWIHPDLSRLFLPILRGKQGTLSTSSRDKSHAHRASEINVTFPIFPTNTIRWPNGGFMLGQRRRRWPNIKPPLVVFSGHV